jgi:hypothetical protein
MGIEGKEPPLRCLIVPSRAIEPPRDAETFKDDGFVRLRLTFTGGEERPRVEVLHSTNDQFRSAVLSHVEDYRMPCLERGETRVATQEFLLLAHAYRGVVASEPRAGALGAKAFSCLTGAERPPNYPRPAISGSNVSNGRVLARAEFSANDAPPRVEIVFNGGDERFARVVRTYMAGYRVPCLNAAELPVVITQGFRFRMEGEGATMLKDTTALSSFVRSIAGLDKHRVRFDFATMDCPFELHFSLWQPYDKNIVAEINAHDPNRREFIEWLRGVDLDAPKKVHDEIVGDAMRISVPCGVLDLL